MAPPTGASWGVGRRGQGGGGHRGSNSIVSEGVDDTCATTTGVGGERVCVCVCCKVDGYKRVRTTYHDSVRAVQHSHSHLHYS